MVNPFTALFDNAMPLFILKFSLKYIITLAGPR